MDAKLAWYTTNHWEFSTTTAHTLPKSSNMLWPGVASGFVFVSEEHLDTYFIKLDFSYL